MGKSFDFNYKPRTKEQVDKRANQKGGGRDSVFKPNLNLFTPHGGENRLRILPPGWEGAEHYGIDIYTHRDIGADKSSYLCLAAHKKGPCPVCEEEARARKEGDDDYAQKLKAGKGVLVYMIDRKSEKEGVKIYRMGWMMDRDIAAQAFDTQTQEIICVDDPEGGYDVTFKREGTGITTKYIGTAIARRSTPLSDDVEQGKEWLQFVVDNPLPDALVFYTYDYIKEVFAGGGKGGDDAKDKGKAPEKEDERPRTRTERRQVKEEEAPPEKPPVARKPITDPEEELDDDTPPKREAPKAEPPKDNGKPKAEGEDDEPVRKPLPARKKVTVPDDDDDD